MFDLNGARRALHKKLKDEESLSGVEDVISELRNTGMTVEINLDLPEHKTAIDTELILSDDDRHRNKAALVEMAQKYFPRISETIKAAMGKLLVGITEDADLVDTKEFLDNMVTLIVYRESVIENMKTDLLDGDSLSRKVTRFGSPGNSVKTTFD
jgi:hypothetical protein